LSGRKSEVLLCLLHLTTKGSDLRVSLLDQSVESFALLRQNLNFVLSLRIEPFECSLVLYDSLLAFIELATDDLELPLQLAEGSSRKSEVLLSSPHLVA
jgi:hypothetical protein